MQGGVGNVQVRVKNLQISVQVNAEGARGLCRGAKAVQVSYGHAGKLWATLTCPISPPCAHQVC